MDTSDKQIGTGVAGLFVIYRGMNGSGAAMASVAENVIFQFLADLPFAAVTTVWGSTSHPGVAIATVRAWAAAAFTVVGVATIIYCALSVTVRWNISFQG